MKWVTELIGLSDLDVELVAVDEYLLEYLALLF
jgi:hypothetical protein